MGKGFLRKSFKKTCCFYKWGNVLKYMVSYQKYVKKYDFLLMNKNSFTLIEKSASLVSLKDFFSFKI